MDLVSREITPPDDLHALSKVHWLSSCRSEQGTGINIEVDVFYLVQARKKTTTIFCYITNDGQKALAAYGLLSQ